MYVKRYGTGPEAYFALHGWGSDHTTFAPLTRYVPTHASLYCADLPGCGYSTAPEEWSVELIVDEIVASIRKVERESLTIIGNCGGAVFGLLSAQKLATVSRVFMIDPFAYLPRYFRLFLTERFGRHAYNATFSNRLGRWITNQSLRGRRNTETDITASFKSVDHEVSLRYLALFAGIGSVERFRGVDLPVQIIYGERSFGAVRRSIPLWQEVLTDLRVWRLDGIGHLPIEEATERLSEIIFSPADDVRLTTKIEKTKESEAKI